MVSALDMASPVDTLLALLPLIILFCGLLVFRVFRFVLEKFKYNKTK